MERPKLGQWAMKLADYNITFVHIKGSDNILADAISKLKVIYIYMCVGGCRRPNGGSKKAKS